MLLEIKQSLQSVRQSTILIVVYLLLFIGPRPGELLVSHIEAQTASDLPMTSQELTYLDAFAGPSSRRRTRSQAAARSTEPTVSVSVTDDPDSAVAGPSARTRSRVGNHATQPAASAALVQEDPRPSAPSPGCSPAHLILTSTAASSSVQSGGAELDTLRSLSPLTTLPDDENEEQATSLSPSSALRCRDVVPFPLTSVGSVPNSLNYVVCKLTGVSRLLLCHLWKPLVRAHVSY